MSMSLNFYERASVTTTKKKSKVSGDTFCHERINKNLEQKVQAHISGRQPLVLPLIGLISTLA